MSVRVGRCSLNFTSWFVFHQTKIGKEKQLLCEVQAEKLFVVFEFYEGLSGGPVHDPEGEGFPSPSNVVVTSIPGLHVLSFFRLLRPCPMPGSGSPLLRWGARGILVRGLSMPMPARRRNRF